MPHLSELWSELSSERQDIAFLAVNAGDSKDVIETWWKEEGFELPAVQQDGYTVSAEFGVNAYPTNYIIGPDGKVLWRGVGFDASSTEDEIRAVFASTRE